VDAKLAFLLRVENNSNKFKNEVLRRIFGPVRELIVGRKEEIT
jgi:hypothetical protein